MSRCTSLDHSGYPRRQPLLRYLNTGAESVMSVHDRKRDRKRFYPNKQAGEPRDDIVLELEGFLPLFW